MKLENICFWKTLSDWKKAVQKKEVVMKKENTCYRAVSNEVLNGLIQCEACAVFPFVNICCMREGKIDLIGDISFFNAILDFISGKRMIYWAGGEIRYQDLDANRKLRLAETRIHAIWIRIFEDEDIRLLADIYKKFI